MSDDVVGPRGDEASRPLLYARVLSLLTDLWFEIDHHGGEQAHRFFTSDAELRFSRAVLTGTEQIRQVYAHRRARGPRVSRHLVTNLRLHDVQRESVGATSSLLLFGDDGAAPRPSTTPAMVGDVADELVWREGYWLIRSRLITYLFIEPATELAVPGQ